MSTRYYDEVLAYKIHKWIPEVSNLRVLKPDETKRLFEMRANDSNDEPLKLPIIAISRSNDFELLSTVKTSRSFDGLKIGGSGANTLHLNVIPIKLAYQLDIYTKTYAEGDEYMRSFLFKLINNPVIKVSIPYNGADIEHIANIRVLSTVSDTSAISERLFSGQFTRWTLQLEIQDAFLFNIPYKGGWKIIDADLEISEKIDQAGEIEVVIQTNDDETEKV